LPPILGMPTPEAMEAPTDLREAAEAAWTSFKAEVAESKNPSDDGIRAKRAVLTCLRVREIRQHLAEDLGNDDIATRVDLSRQIVSEWRKRFFLERLPGLDEEPRGGCPSIARSPTSWRRSPIGPRAAFSG